MRVFFALILAVTLVVAHFSRADASGFSVGYTTLSMGKANTWMSSGVSPDYFTPLNNSYCISLDAGPLRVGYVLPGQIKLALPSVIDFAFEPSLMSAMVGMRSAQGETSYGLYVGYGMATVNVIEHDYTTTVPISINIPYQSSGMMAEAVIGYSAGAIEIDVGYRYAPMTSFKTAQSYLIDTSGDGVPDAVIPSGDMIPDLDGTTPLVFDYSGLTVSLCLRFGGGGSSAQNYGGYQGYNQNNQGYNQAGNQNAQVSAPGASQQKPTTPSK